MMRGINHQNIFEDEEDNWQFINTLDRMRMRTDDDGLPCGTNCTYYGYCLMTNHFHLLIREREEKVGRRYGIAELRSYGIAEFPMSTTTTTTTHST